MRTILFVIVFRPIYKIIAIAILRTTARGRQGEVKSAED